MIICALLLSHFLLHSARTYAAPLETGSRIHRRDIATATGETSAVQETGTPRISVELLTDYDPVDGASFFYINHLCRGDRRNIDPKGPFKDRYDYLLRAIKDATTIADSTTAIFWKDIFGKLPQPLSAGTNAPDLITDNDNNYVNLVLPDPTPACAGTPTYKPSAQAAYVQSKIGAYCTHVASSGWIVNSTLGVYGPIGYGAGDNDLWISVSFDPRCHPNVSYTVDLDDCQKYLGIALNGCNTDSSTAKWGGQVEARCTLWNITTRTGHDMKPPNGYPPVA